MKIGIVSDIHGDIEGLERAIKLLQAQEVAQIVCAGDLVDKGDEPDAVAALIKAHNIPCVQGNHDYAAIKHQAWVRQFGNLQLEEWQKQLLKDETVGYLEAMPQTLSFVWEGISVMLAHGTPWSRDTYLFPMSFPKAFKRVADEAKTEIVILGHTHEPMIADVRGTCLILNPGSVYRQHYESTPRRTCGLLSLPDMNFSVFDLDSERTVTPEHVRIRLNDR